MDEGGGKEEVQLPPDYVSLAQLQERWLQKQEEMKLKQKQEEEEMKRKQKQEEEEMKLKQKQEEEEKRARDEREQKEKNRNQRGHAKIVGGFASGTGAILDKGKGKEIVNDGPRGENNKRREVIRGGKTSYFRRTTVVEDRAKDFGGGDRCEEVGIVAGEAIRAGNWSMGGGEEDGVETCNVSVVEVLPSSGVMEEIADVNGADLRSGLRENGRNWGSRRVKESEQSKTELNLEKKVENERDPGQNWRGRGRGGGKNGYRRERLKGDKADSGLEKKTEDGVSEVRSKVGSLCVVDSNKAEEELFEREGSNGDEMASNIEKVDHEVLAGDTAKICKNRGAVKGYQRNENWRRNPGQVRRHARPEVAAEKDRIEGESSNGNKVALDIEKKVDHEVLSGDSEKIGENRGLVEFDQNYVNRRKGFAKGRRYTRPDLSAKEYTNEGGGLNGNIVAQEIEKKVDHEVLSEESEKTGENRKVHQTNENRRKDFAKGRRYTRPDLSPKEDTNEGEGLNGNIVAQEIEKKVDHEVLSEESEKIGENRGLVEVDQNYVNRRKGFAKGRRYTRPDLSPKEDTNEGEGLNGNIVAQEIEKKMNHEVLAGESAKTGENRWVVKGNQKNEDQRRDFGPDRRFTGSAISVEEDRTLGENSNRWVVKGNQKNEDQRRDFGPDRRFTEPEISVEEDRTLGENSNGDKVQLEIEKVGHEVMAKESAKISNNAVVKGYQRNENWNCHFKKGYRRNGNWNSGFGRRSGRGHTRSEISDRRWKMSSEVNGMVWVKKEEKLGE